MLLLQSAKPPPIISHLPTPGVRFHSLECPHQQKTRLLEGIQNNAGRFMYQQYDWTTSVTALNHDLRWPTLQQRRNTHDLVMWYKVQFSMVNMKFPSIIVPRPRDSRDRIYPGPTQSGVLQTDSLCVNHPTLEHTLYVTSQRFLPQ